MTAEYPIICLGDPEQVKVGEMPVGLRVRDFRFDRESGHLDLTFQVLQRELAWQFLKYLVHDHLLGVLIDECYLEGHATLGQWTFGRHHQPPEVNLTVQVQRIKNFESFDV